MSQDNKIIIELIGTSVSKLEEARSIREIKLNKEIIQDLKKIEDFIIEAHNQSKYLNIKEYKIKSVSLKPLSLFRMRLFTISIVIFVLSLIFNVYYGKFDSSDGFYHYAQETPYTYPIFYGFASISIVSFLVSLYCYRDKNRIPLRLYIGNIQQLVRELNSE
jgi:hypothetical protein